MLSLDIGTSTAKGGNSDFALANPSNLRPIFTQEQLSMSLHRTVLANPIIHNAIIMDIQQLHNDIRSFLTLDPLSSTHLPTPTAPNWTLNNSGLLCHHNQIYVPDANDLRLRVLQYKHDQILSRHAGQNKTLMVI
jgi:hypothetical protein